MQVRNAFYLAVVIDHHAPTADSHAKTRRRSLALTNRAGETKY